MNGIDKITARIENDAVADAARIAQQTHDECEAIRAEGEKKAQDSYWEKFRQGVAAAEDRVQRLAKTADMEARKSVLSFKQSIVAEAFDKAEAKLNGLQGEEYVSFLAALAEKAAVTGTEELVFSAADRKAYGKKVVDRANAALRAAGGTGRLTLSDTEGAFSRGLVCRQGSVSVNCTVEALMAQARGDMASGVAEALFG